MKIKNDCPKHSCKKCDHWRTNPFILAGGCQLATPEKCIHYHHIDCYFRPMKEVGANEH